MSDSSDKPPKLIVAPLHFRQYHDQYLMEESELSNDELMDIFREQAEHTLIKGMHSHCVDCSFRETDFTEERDLARDSLILHTTATCKATMSMGVPVCPIEEYGSSFPQPLGSYYDANGKKGIVGVDTGYVIMDELDPDLTTRPKDKNKPSTPGGGDW